MRIAVAAGPGGSGVLRPLGPGPEPVAPDLVVPDLVGAVRDAERTGGRSLGVRAGEPPEHPRWVWADARALYPALLAAGVRPARCHDLALTESLLLAHDGRYGEPRSPAAAYARLRGLPVPDDHTGAAPVQATLFETEKPGPPADEIDVVAAVHADQLTRIAATADPRRFRLLVAAESAGALVAAELAHDGMPWRADVHDELLTGLLGPRPVHGMRPARLQALADQVSAAFGRPVNPDSPQQIVKAFKSAGVSVPSTRSQVLKEVEHPGVAPLLAYKELARLFSFHGWAWADQWVREGRFHPEYVVAGVVSGRWATSGGGALQIPKVMRRVVVADEGWRLVVADAAQLEPRVLAAMAGDRGLAAAAGEIDLYAALAQAFGGLRDNAKIALLSAMYGGTSGDAPKLLAVMRQRFPRAYAFVEEAARAGEEGKLVRSWLGRTSPPPSARWRELVLGPEGARAARDRGRFTRNFVVQATAAEWALTLLAVLRGRLSGPARLVFFQHDEVMVHCPAEQADEVVAAVGVAAEEATRLLFGDTPVRFPMHAVPVGCYADAK
ncbi:bifunctional 3'-5' exonuclease/DNA polymerase [Spongiactinospora sp. TRM90649]|uniref:bifunctional 3'-5' exonuclease/DNA polymerase n=1 Tax=Spongiactinospora sp. TRM90649 TaxID=3031114 RepID=UPI0023F86DD3|nr:bifunctional 3'-5' exonuclease/DNA polymerase [Spongiactinospora sp. TRM90649]MDF5757863.1 bifunctional 3'-5' exonuclease/DNA polymerase [Spongiactinospora sp. TRM90649]